MDDYYRYQRKLRRRRLLQAAAAWIVLVGTGILAAVGLWTVLTILLVALS